MDKYLNRKKLSIEEVAEILCVEPETVIDGFCDYSHLLDDFEGKEISINEKYIPNDLSTWQEMCASFANKMVDESEYRKYCRKIMEKIARELSKIVLKKDGSNAYEEDDFLYHDLSNAEMKLKEIQKIIGLGGQNESSN